ncbi:hypothetical protein C8R43DRAFT_343482 [Mycena crocata]|nr:hypothetical protein C8R43DRAFT_343482 [Mycena crocata]
MLPCLCRVQWPLTLRRIIAFSVVLSPSTVSREMTSPSGLVPLPPNIGSITASPLLGSLLNFWLFGALVVQVYVYRLCFPKDRLAVKLLVYLVALSMLMCTCLNAADAYYWWGSGFGDIVKFGNARFSPGYTPLWGSVVALAVQLFFCYRISVFRSGAIWWSVIIAVISLLQAAGGIGGGIKALVSGNAQHDHIRTILVYLWLIGDAVADLMIAVTMSRLLLRTSEPQTEDIVRGVIRLIIETNAFSASVAIIGLALFAGMPGSDYFVCPTMVLPGIYANTLLVLLNNRAAPDRCTNRTDHPAPSTSDGTTTTAGKDTLTMQHWKTVGVTTPPYTATLPKHGSMRDAINGHQSRMAEPGIVRRGVLQPHVSTWDDESYKTASAGRWEDLDGIRKSLDLGDVENHPYGSAGTYTTWQR